MVIKVEHT